LSYAVGLGIWYYLNLTFTEIPYPSQADIAFLSFYPLMFIGSIYLVRIYKTFITKGIVRDSILICVVSFIGVFYFHTKIDLSPNISLATKIVNIAYPVSDVIIMSVGLIAIRIGGGKLHPSFYLFSLGLLVQGVADLVFDYRTANSYYWNGDIADTLYLLSGFILSISLFEIIHNLTQVSKAPVNSPLQPASPANPIPAPANQTTPTQPNETPLKTSSLT
jgi:hypothetical protein